MTKETHKKIRQLMKECGVWMRTVQMEVYTAEEFISKFGDTMPDELQKLIKENVSRLQSYFDERILEPINRNQ
jgi:predicted Zn-dependent protease with MMP-like domain